MHLQIEDYRVVQHAPTDANPFCKQPKIVQMALFSKSNEGCTYKLDHLGKKK